MRNPRKATYRSALAIGISCLVGCQGPGHPAKPAPSILGGTSSSAITASQEADAQIALGRVAEQRGDLDQAMSAYRSALDRDRRRADAYQRLAVLHDKQGKFRESATLYGQALEADPGNPDIYCDMGYSLYLQRRWAEAEMNLKQAITRDPDHLRAHSNLGLVLAHNARPEAAVAEFRKSGCDEAEARENVAFALTTERRWGEARTQYRLALRDRPGSETAQTRLRELDTLIAKVEAPKRPGAPRDRALVTVAAPAPRAASGRPSTIPLPAPVAARGPMPAPATPKIPSPVPRPPVVAPKQADRATTAVPTAPLPQSSAEPAPK